MQQVAAGETEQETKEEEDEQTSEKEVGKQQDNGPSN